MQTKPFISAPMAVKSTGLTKPTVNAALEQLQALNLVKEITGRRRNRVYAYRAFLDILNEGGDPLDAMGARRAARASQSHKSPSRHTASANAEE